MKSHESEAGRRLKRSSLEAVVMPISTSLSVAAIQSRTARIHMRLSRPANTGFQGPVSVGPLRIHVGDVGALRSVVENVFVDLLNGYTDGYVPRGRTLDVAVSMAISDTPLAQDTPNGRYVPYKDGSYLSRWGFWDVRLYDFERDGSPRAELLLSPDIPSENHVDGVIMFLRTVIASAAPLVDSLMFHGCAVAEQNLTRGILFLGASGDGKTTMARRLDAWRCLGDDTVLVTLDGNGVPHVSGTPFAGSEGNPRLAYDVPFEEVYFLQPRSDALRIVPLDTSQAFGEMMNRLMWFVDGGVLRERMLDLMGRLASSLRAAHLESGLEHDISEVFTPLPC